MKVVTANSSTGIYYVLKTDGNVYSYTISKDDYKQMYTNSYNSKGTHLQGIIFKQTLDQFIELMFSKPVNDTTYAELEASVQTIAENL